MSENFVRESRVIDPLYRDVHEEVVLKVRGKVVHYEVDTETYTALLTIFPDQDSCEGFVE